MTKPLFAVGDSGEIAGVEWRIVRGDKTPGDIVIQVRCPQWTKPKMSLSFLLADFHFQSEDILRDEGYLAPGALGGQFFANHLRSAWQVGWKWAAERLMRDQERRRRREAA